MITLCLNCNKWSWLLVFSDIRVGRNLARAFLEYYRFTNVIPIPPLKELLARKRPKTHRSRSFRRKPEYQPRPRTTRNAAPINYFDLGIEYDSTSSVEGSPVRYPFHLSTYRVKSSLPAYSQQQQQLQQQQISDQFSLMTIKNANFNQLDFSHRPDKRVRTMQPRSLEPVKPHLSIIDVNMLTRGSLEEATKSKQLQTQQSTTGKNRK